MNAIIRLGVAIAMSLALAPAAQATIWTSTPGWSQFADDEGMTEGPGGGGQLFDAEAFYYKIVGNQLSIGLQTGYQGIHGDGSYLYSDGKTYWAGDLALTINGTNYGVDFGFYTENYDQALFSGPSYDPAPVDTSQPGYLPGWDPAGLYSNVSWDNGVYQGHTISNPFALNGGTLVTGANFSQQSGTVGSDSYYRIVSFDVSALGLNLATSSLSLSAHWTMSCGNDNINGNLFEPANPSVPEPGSMALFGLGIFVLGGVRNRRR